MIAFDQRALELILEQTGPVAVPEYGETVSSNNLLDLLDRHVHTQIGRVDEWQRKAFVGATAASVLQVLMTARPEQLPGYLSALHRALEGKHVLLYLGTPTAAQLAAELNWDGHMYVGAGDYLYAVSANLSPNYVDGYVERAARYMVDLGAARPQAHLTLEFTNRVDLAATIDWATPNYRNYLRVYVPWESELSAARGFASEAEARTECGRTVFAGLVDVPPGEHVTVTLEYALNPAVLEGGAYSLVVQKQAGINATPLAVEVRNAAVSTAKSNWLGGDQYYRWDGGSELAVGPLPGAMTAGVACATPKPPPLALQPPVHLAIPQLGVDAPVTTLKVRPTGEMEVPTEGESIGWYDEGARPGYAGNFVLAAHVDWAGRPAVFWRLHELRPGDQFVVTDAAGVQHRYAVEWNQSARPEDVPLGQIVGPTNDKLLTAITCTGNFNPLTRDYSHRQIVRARLVESS
jgi:hypothetical protein